MKRLKLLSILMLLSTSACESGGDRDLDTTPEYPTPPIDGGGLNLTQDQCSANLNEKIGMGLMGDSKISKGLRSRSLYVALAVHAGELDKSCLTHSY